MDEYSARLILGLDPDFTMEDVQEALENEIFTHKKVLLSRLLDLEIWELKLRKIAKSEAAANRLGVSIDSVDVSDISGAFNEGATTLQLGFSKLQLTLSNALSYSEFEFLYREIVKMNFYLLSELKKIISTAPVKPREAYPDLNAFLMEYSTGEVGKNTQQLYNFLSSRVGSGIHTE